MRVVVMYTQKKKWKGTSSANTQRGDGQSVNGVQIAEVRTRAAALMYILCTVCQL